MNILVIGTPSSNHDFKWLKYIAHHFSGKIYLIGEEPNTHNHDNEKYAQEGVHLLPPLPSFSLSSPWRSGRALFQVNRILRQLGIDVVHVIFPTPHLYWMSLSNIPIVVSTRGSDVLVVIKELSKKRGIKKKILYWLIKRNLQKVKAITSTSELQKTFLEEEFSFLCGKTSIVRTGVDVEFIQSIPVPEQTSEKINVFSPRFFLPIYDQISQIKALRRLPEGLRKKIKITFVRGKAFDAAYDKKIKEELRTVDFAYEILEFMDLQQMVKEYKSAHLVIMTPLSDGTPNSALEAMVCRVPLIMSDLPYNSPLFDQTCFKVSVQNENDMAHKIEKALQNYPAEMLDKAYNAVLHYGNQAEEMQKIINLYHRFRSKKQ